METTPVNETFDFAKVPGWYTLCFNSSCPLRNECMRFYAGTFAPADLETASCVLPHTLKDGHCRWFDKITTVTMAAGFSHLYDHVLKYDFTRIRKSLTRFLHGTKFYYQYQRGERPLTPEQQKGIKKIVAACGYTEEVVFDRYFSEYTFGDNP